ncbi:MAG: 3-oxoacyl-ACP synthase, partial [Desulfobacterales bacterium]|nr:3-oxoacyl-ACP synthase [Desulfobacterales bacterium]
MSGSRIFITGMGVISPLGRGLQRTRDALRRGRSGIRPLRLFASPHASPLPVGEVRDPLPADGPPRAHALALAAAGEALAGCEAPPDAVVLGVTTGGMLRTEELLKEERRDKASFTLHSTGSVAEIVAGTHGCKGPVLTISTACSSGAAAIGIALEMLRAGLARRVLAGGADSLCRLTFHGFNSLQLIDPEGARPLDKDRRGMSVAEGAAMLLLEGDESPPPNAAAEILGAGFSCDAHHPAAPRPDGVGAAEAIRAALDDGGLSAGDIDYISLHGTGTADNDLAEARAVRAIFGERTPPLSSVKGATGHSLAAAGAMEAVIAAMAVSEGWIPGNTGCRTPDPELKIEPALAPEERPVRAVLSNSFGFGGNNVSLVIGSPDRNGSPPPRRRTPSMTVLGSALITGAGGADDFFRALARGEAGKGALPLAEISRGLPPRAIRRLKRLPRMALSLAEAARADAGLTEGPGSVFFGTGWGALSETHDFLDKLFDSDERFTSPIDFIGSVHNAPAGQIAIHSGATGPNITTCGGDYAFEQALYSAGLL